MPGPLDGLRVLDFSIMIAGPYAARMLADLGAEVIKVEPPEGDHIRSAPPLRDGNSTYFGHLNCGKKSLCVDLRKEAGRALARELASRVDVVVENFRPGVMARLGLGYEALAKENAGLVYCSISGFGQTGPDANRPAYAPVVHAASGYELANIANHPHLDEPVSSNIFIADILAGALAFGAVNAALVRRARDGKGEHVDCTLMDAMLGMLVYECQSAQFEVTTRRPLYRPVRASDGFVIIAPISQNNFEDMARAAGHEEWTRDERFATRTARAHHWGALMALMQEWAAGRTATECEEAMREGGVPCSRYQTYAEAMKSPYAEARDSFATVTDPAGAFAVANPAFKLRNAAAAARPWVARLGEHNDEILGELLGRERAAIETLYGGGVLKRA
jgi:crotonobetainyl-CoA:carnitine CoA-transferase CaiB-like acyl-CoA transferase